MSRRISMSIQERGQQSLEDLSNFLKKPSQDSLIAKYIKYPEEYLYFWVVHLKSSCRAFYL